MIDSSKSSDFRDYPSKLVSCVASLAPTPVSLDRNRASLDLKVLTNSFQTLISKVYPNFIPAVILLFCVNMKWSRSKTLISRVWLNNVQSDSVTLIFLSWCCIIHIKSLQTEAYLSISKFSKKYLNKTVFSSQMLQSLEFLYFIPFKGF